MWFRLLARALLTDPRPFVVEIHAVRASTTRLPAVPDLPVIMRAPHEVVERGTVTAEFP
ncbi:MAG: hypothetical protein OXF56_26230 [Rhodobacteraceae bacterium]|nr:hypothetical protein [Paracoccaceae bacterium]